MDPSLRWDDEGNLSLMPTKAIVVFPLNWFQDDVRAAFVDLILGAEVLGLKRHRSATGQRQHSGVRALQI